MNNKVRIFLTSLSSLIVLGFIVLSAVNNREYQTTIFAMDTVMNIKASGLHAEEGVNAAVLEIYRIEKIFSTTDTNSEISKINESPGKWVEVSHECADLIADSLEISEETDGALDISIYPLVLAWGFTLDDFEVPSETKIKVNQAAVDYSKIEVEGNRVKTGAGQMIDLGAVTKGYTADRVCEILSAHKVKNAIINLGGNIMTMGQAPRGSWQIGIQDPADSDKILGVVSVKGDRKAVVTSGNYERFFEADGKKYGHIIDPFTGYPADSGLTSVTIISDSAALADELSTACYIMGLEKTEKLREIRKDFDYIAVTDTGEILMSDNSFFQYNKVE